MTQLLSSGLEIFSQQLLDLDRRQSDLNKGLRATVSNWASCRAGGLLTVLLNFFWILYEGLQKIRSSVESSVTPEFENKLAEYISIRALETTPDQQFRLSLSLSSIRTG